MHGRLDADVHRSRPWRIHGLLEDFRLEDVWALPTPGGPDDFGLLIDGFAGADPSRESPSRAARALWALRWKLGEIFGWDDEDTGLDARVRSLRERLPEDLREGTRGPSPERLPFSPLYLTENEWAAEIANSTVHGVMHLGWVSDGDGGWHGELAVYVKPNGLLGELYMLAIRPFRHLIVYPPMLEEVGRRWQERPGATGPERRAPRTARA